MRRVAIERPVESDWPGILEILKAANLHHIGGPEMRTFPLSDCFVAREGSTVVGVCGYRMMDAWTARNTLTAVAPTHRGNGLATRLKRACVDFLADSGVRTLYTNCDRPEVIEWNQREFGFRPTGKLIPKQEDFGRKDADHWVNLVSEWPFRACPISPEELQDYRQRGFIVLRGRFSAREARAWAAEAERLWRQPGLVECENFRVQARMNGSDERVLERLDWLVPLSETFAGLAQDPRLTEPAMQLLEAPPVLFKDKLIIRPPGTDGYGLHQDFPYWEASGISADHLLTACVAIDETGRQNGMLGLFPGYHDRRLASPPAEPLDTDLSEVDARCEEIVSLEPGDLVLFHSLAPHRSGPNRSDRSRRMLYFTYTQSSYGADIYQRYFDLRASKETSRTGV